MLRQSILPALLLLGSLSMSAQTSDERNTAVPDTLLNVSSAQSITLSSSPRAISLNVHRIDNTPNTFFYVTKGPKKSGAHDSYTKIECPDISGVLITETPDSLSIRFTDPNGERMAYSFPFADPENRTVRTYIGSKGRDFGFNISSNKKTKWDVISDGLAFGWVSTVNDKTDMDLSAWRSTEFTWNNLIAVRMTHRSISLSLGFGLHWQQLASKSGYYFHKSDDATIVRLPYAEDVTKGESHLKFFSMQMPLLFGVNFGHNRYCGFRFGPVVNFNTGAHITTKYVIGDCKYKVSTESIGQRKVTVDGMAIINYRSIGLYARYSPMKRFNDRTDLDFATLSAGIMLGF
ncbi:MAG: hypothetical protein K2J27_05075 [Duncaniella sp.]|nr:hypothetical protein [Duncaniella sp.]